MANLLNDSIGGFGGGLGLFGGGNNSDGLLGGIILGSLIGGRGLFGGRGNDCNEGHGDNARFIAVENSIDNVSEQLTQQAVLNAIANSASTAALRFDAVQSNINEVSTQGLLAAERTNSNIADVKHQNAINQLSTNANIQEVKFQDTLNFQSLSRQMADCCCETKMAIHADGDQTRSLINALDREAMRDKNAALTLEVSQLKQNQYFAHLSDKIDRQNDALINFGTILTTKVNTNGIQG